MGTMLPDRRSVRGSYLGRFGAVGLGFLFSLLLGGTALAQQAPVTGTVTATGGAPLRGVTVLVEGTETRTVTDATGRYSINAPSNGVLVFSQLGRRVVQQPVNGRTRIDVTMEPVAFLDEVVVTAYTEQRRADITGAVTSVNVDAANRQSTASVLQRLDATAPGITVEASGSPGSRSTVRIRGISSFQNNDPLYIIDGTPVQDTYINWLNPNDITSIQVLKDASAASIYGARASNGVIVIETTRRGVTGPPRATLRVRTGIATPVRGYDDFLITDALEYYEVVRRSYVNAGQTPPTNIYGSATNPQVPAFIWPNNCGPNASEGLCTNVDPGAYSYPGNLIMPGSRGTNWWDAVFGTGRVGDYNLDVSGGGQDTRYGVSFNYYDQEGTAAYNQFRRGSIRVNTAFDRGRFSVGENIALSHDRHYGGLPTDEFGEGGILGKNILMQPVVPVYDIQGNFASGKANTLGNNTNPLKVAYEARNNLTRNNRLFGNVFAGYAASREFSVRTQFGFNVGNGSFTQFNPIFPENAEPTLTNSMLENSNQFTDWTWSNTMRYQRSFSQHNFDVLLGQEANENTNRFIQAGMSNLLSVDPNDRYIQDALGDAASKNVNSTGGRSTLLSFFGKADYNFADKYVLSFTLRQDGSSRLGPDHRWGTFPAFGLGWRVTKEPFLANNPLFTDVMLRFGWGVTGNQGIPAGRIVAQFGGSRGDTYYDVTGSNGSVAAGFRETRIGNPNLKWEENESYNVGADVTMLDGRLNFVLDVYRRDTDNLLFDPPIPATAGIADAPIVNIGQMRNAGFDLSIGYRTAMWSVTLNGSRYRNRILRVDGEQNFFFGPVATRFGSETVINMVGHPIGSFYGLVVDGFFQTPAEAAAHQPVNGNCATRPCQDGAAEGRFRFRDVDGDGEITLADRTIIGSPHPDFTAGLDVGFRWRLWDFNATLFGTFGNEIFDVQKEFYVFRNFSTNVRRDLLTDSWTPQNPNAKYPKLDRNDVYSNRVSSFYVDDGSYVRLRNVQIGYSVPPTLSRWLPASRIYVQGENLFTITKYPGLDPALPAIASNRPAGDVRDQYRGIDRGTYPSNRAFSIGLVTTF